MNLVESAPFLMVQAQIFFTKHPLGKRKTTSLSRDKTSRKQKRNGKKWANNKKNINKPRFTPPSSPFHLNKI
jgi:hypothetical protein